MVSIPSKLILLLSSSMLFATSAPISEEEKEYNENLESPVGETYITYNCLNSYDLFEVQLMSFASDSNPILDYSRPFNFIIHGWHDGLTGGAYNEFEGKPYVSRRGRPELWMEPLGQEWVKRADCNVCIIDWSHLAKGGYIDTINKIPRVVADIMKEIEKYKKRGMMIPNITLVGHSLGAHIAGAVGRAIREEYGVKAKAIYGTFCIKYIFFNQILQKLFIIIQDWILLDHNSDLILAF